MGYWSEPPYHGDGVSRKPKRKKRYVNLKERRKLDREFLFNLLFFLILLSAMALRLESGIGIVAIIILGVFFLIFYIAMLSFNKFREGHDIDTSDEQTNKRSRNHKDPFD